MTLRAGAMWLGVLVLAASAARADTTLTLTGGCFQPGDPVVIAIDMTDAQGIVVGGQFFLWYDQSRLQYVSADPGDEPFVVEIYEAHPGDQGAGTIDYSVGIDVPGGGEGTDADTTMARITFNALVAGCDLADLVWFRPHDPPTRLSTEGGEIVPLLVNLGPQDIDGTPPVITSCPESTYAQRPCALPSPDTGLVAAEDNCDESPTITWEGDSLNGTGCGSDELVVTRTYRATDDCGNYSECFQTFTIVDKMTLIDHVPYGWFAVDYVDVGDPDSEALHNMPLVGADAWGPIEPAAHPGGWGGHSDPDLYHYRTVWGFEENTRTASLDMDFGNGLGEKKLGLHFLDGLSDDAYSVYVDDNPVAVLEYADCRPYEVWRILWYDVGALTGVHTLTIEATGPQGSVFNPYGQLAIDEIATATAFQGSDLYDALPAGFYTIDYLDVGLPVLEAWHDVPLSGPTAWGPIEPAAHPGGWGGHNDPVVYHFRAVWGYVENTISATCCMYWGERSGNKKIGLYHLDGGSDDSFDVYVDDVLVGQYADQGTSEVWHQTWFDVGDLCGVHLITIVATAPAGPYWNPFGQVAIDEITTVTDNPQPVCKCGDIDADGWVDLNDFATFAVCFTGSAASGHHYECCQDDFVCADLDGDNDVDLNDFATFAVWYNQEPECEP